MPAAQRQQERAERTRAQIIEIAAAAFAAHGYDGVSLNEIVLRSGLSKGAFYFHFPSKEEIALAVFEAKQKVLLSELAKGPGGRGHAGAAERLAWTLRRRNALLRRDPSLVCVTRLGNELNTRITAGSTLTSAHERAIDGIAEIIEQGRRSGEFRADLDAKATAHAIFAWVVGVDTLSMLSSGGADLEERCDDVLRLLLPALSAPSEEPAKRRRS